jgi:hypothetical protein
MSFFHKGILTLWFSDEHTREREPLVQRRTREDPTVEPVGRLWRFAVSQLAKLEYDGFCMHIRSCKCVVPASHAVGSCVVSCKCTQGFDVVLLRGLCVNVLLECGLPRYIVGALL